MKQTSREEKKDSGSEFAYFSVDSYANGIAFGQHRPEDGADTRDYYALRLGDDVELNKLRSRYLLEKTNPLHELELQLMKLSSQGLLRRSVIYFGVATDPFFPFEGKFDASMKFLELFQRYTPGMLIIQTRSPLIILAMPVLKRLGKQASVTLGIETPLEDVVSFYTPGLPRVSERLRTAEALRKFKIEVTLQVNPLLPYGEWHEDTDHFAEILVKYADYISVKPIVEGLEPMGKRLRASELAKLLAQERKFHYLRHDSADPLIAAIEKRAAEKLRQPKREYLVAQQMEFFAA